jgi:hypothetical protein
MICILKSNLSLTGQLYNGKFYWLGDGIQNEVYDISSNVWSSWPALPVRTAAGQCMVTWRDSFIIFGGEAALTTAQAFNITTQVFFFFRSQSADKLTIYSVPCSWIL